MSSEDEGATLTYFLKPYDTKADNLETATRRVL